MRVFKQATGATIREELIAHRVAEAARLLTVGPTLNVLEVAARSGFGSSNQLCEAFKRQTGTTPARYRRGK